MKIKRYFAADMRQAMKLVKDDLGLDATIVSQRSLAGGIEISASVDTGFASAAQQPKANTALQDALAEARQNVADVHNQAQLAETGVFSDVGRNRQIGESDVADKESMARLLKSLQGGSRVDDLQSSRDEQRPKASDPAMDALRDELNGMRELLQQQLGSVAWGQFSDRSPKQAMLWRRLSSMGLSSALCKELLASTELNIEEDAAKAWRKVLARLAGRMFTTKRDLVDDGGIFAFVGPTGSGKTTTIAKLATRHVLKHGSDSLGLITMDTFRIGAYEQVKTLGRILQVPVRIIDKHEKLQEAIDSLSEKRLILIDTAGLHHQDEALQVQLRMLNNVRPMVRSLLVVSTTSQQQVMKSSYHTYKSTRLVGSVLTKLDEAVSLGESINMLVDNQLPASYLADGQLIPNDIGLARAHNLISRAVAVSAQAETDDEQMMQGFAATNGRSASVEQRLA